MINNNRGMALIVTLAIVVILLTAGLQLGKIASQSVIQVQTENDSFIAEQKAISGINLAMLILAQDAQDSKLDSLQEDWAIPEKLAGAVDQLGFKHGDLVLDIEDELGKIKLNALVKEFPGNENNWVARLILERFLKLRVSGNKAEDNRDPQMIISCTKDWLDSMDDDAIDGLSGVESDYYLGLEHPYSSANGPFNHVSEFLNVKGVDIDLLKYNYSDGLKDQNILSNENELEFKDVFTVFGMKDKAAGSKKFGFSGRVNLNTASVEVLAAIMPEGMEKRAQELADYRVQKGSQGIDFANILDKGWYEKVIEFSEREMDNFDRSIRYSSNLFRATCSAWENDTKVTLSAVIKREKQAKNSKWTCRVIQLEKG